uniref:Sterol O-acyltransferase 2 n=2 Tax=Lygus hesperus TaxID=30085 RepID=A0A0A9WBT7_LYGHE
METLEQMDRQHEHVQNRLNRIPGQRRPATYKFADQRDGLTDVVQQYGLLLLLIHEGAVLAVLLPVEDLNEVLHLVAFFARNFYTQVDSVAAALPTHSCVKFFELCGNALRCALPAHVPTSHTYPPAQSQVLPYCQLPVAQYRAGLLLLLLLTLHRNHLSNTSHILCGGGTRISILAFLL